MSSNSLFTNIKNLMLFENRSSAMQNSLDERIYASVAFDNQRQLQQYMTNGVNLISTPINFLAFYLILAKSRKEMKVFKYALFICQFSFYLANIHFGTLANFAVLFPFPGVTNVGFISDVCNSFLSTIIWLVLFGSYVCFTFVILLIRLRIVARKNKKFDLSNRAYILSCCFIVFYVFVPVLSLWLNSYSRRNEQFQIVAKYFPNNLQIFNNPSVHIDISKTNQQAIITLLIFLVASGLMIYISLYTMVIYEITQQTKLKSVRMSKNQKKVVNNLIFQSAVCAVFVFFSCLIVMRNYFIDPSVDNRISIAIANSLMVGSSIPTLVLMIYRNSSYRNHVSWMVGARSFAASDNQVSVIVGRRSTF